MSEPSFITSCLSSTGRTELSLIQITSSTSPSPLQLKTAVSPNVISISCGPWIISGRPTIKLLYKIQLTLKNGPQWKSLTLSALNDFPSMAVGYLQWAAMFNCCSLIIFESQANLQSHTNAFESSLNRVSLGRLVKAPSGMCFILLWYKNLKVIL